MAFHPQWPATREVYLSYTRTPGGRRSGADLPGLADRVLTSVVSRFKSTDGTTLDTHGRRDPQGRAAVHQPQGRHDPVRPRRLSVLRPRRRRRRQRPVRLGPEPRARCSARSCASTSTQPGGQYNVPADNPFVGERRRPRRDLVVRPPQPVPLELRHGHRRPVGRRRRPGHLGGDRSRGQGRQLRLEHLRGLSHAAAAPRRCATRPGCIDPIVEHPRTEAQSITGGARLPRQRDAEPGRARTSTATTSPATSGR